MKIDQIQLPGTFDEMISFLDELQKDDVYAVFFISQSIADKYKVSYTSRIRPFEAIWNSATERGTTEAVACNLLEGCSALIRIDSRR